jgi:polyferredoxin
LAVPYQLLADAVLILHFGVVIFVVGGLILVLIGNGVGWHWVNVWWFRLLHLVSIAFVVVQAWLGQWCPLTLLESWLRERAGVVAYNKSFIEHWLQQLIFYEAPFWVFTLVYTLFGLLVAWAWWKYPPAHRLAQRPVSPTASPPVSPPVPSHHQPHPAPRKDST